MSGKIKVVKIEAESGSFVGEILKVTSSVREKSLKVYLKSFSEPDESQLKKINAHFKEMLHFSNNIDIETAGIETLEELAQSLELLKETLDPEAVSRAKLCVSDDRLYFDVEKRD